MGKISDEDFARSLRPVGHALMKQLDAGGYRAQVEKDPRSAGRGARKRKRARQSRVRQVLNRELV